MTKQELRKILNNVHEEHKKKPRKPSIIFYTSIANAERMEKEINNWIRAGIEIKKASK